MSTGKQFLSKTGEFEVLRKSESAMPCLARLPTVNILDFFLSLYEF